jgi:hypothetical protein
MPREYGSNGRQLHLNVLPIVCTHRLRQGADWVPKQYASLADCDGRVTGQDAKKLFPRASLPDKTLARIWSLSDTYNRGYLDYDSFVRAMQFIRLAQDGEELSEKYLEIRQKVCL